MLVFIFQPKAITKTSYTRQHKTHTKNARWKFLCSNTLHSNSEIENSTHSLQLMIFNSHKKNIQLIFKDFGYIFPNKYFPPSLLFFTNSQPHACCFSLPGTDITSHFLESNTHTHTHTHTCWYMWFMSTLHRRNGLYTEQTIFSITESVLLNHVQAIIPMSLYTFVSSWTT